MAMNPPRLPLFHGRGDRLRFVDLRFCEDRFHF